eukprot:9361136-Lingulodinium_polyedra.AAC.1
MKQLSPIHNGRITARRWGRHCSGQVARLVHWRQWRKVVVGPPERFEATAQLGPRVRLTEC